MKRKSKGITLLILGLILFIIAFIADKILKIAISDVFVMFYWILVLFLIAYGLNLFFNKNEG